MPLSHSRCRPSSSKFGTAANSAVARAGDGAAQATDKAGQARDLCPAITGAGTNSFEFEAASGIYTELQCGSYIFMDADCGRNRDRDGGPFTTFEPSLYVWATVMSRPAEDREIVDAGLKALAFDSGPPIVCDEPTASYERASDEHGRLGISGTTNRLGLDDKIRLIPGHCDPTVNLYDWYVYIRNNRVEQLWPITARWAVY
jgi:3-hydroxy-D-aspartate aldolase